MKDSRIGESLWLEWLGDADFSMVSQFSAVYYTEDHVDIENEIVKRALASALQRDGIAITLSEGFKLVESATVSHKYAGYIDEEFEPVFCDEFGMTDTGDTTDDITPITLVELRWQE